MAMVSTLGSNSTIYYQEKGKGLCDFINLKQCSPAIPSPGNKFDICNFPAKEWPGYITLNWAEGGVCLINYPRLSPTNGIFTLLKAIFNFNFR